ncbi:MAG: glycosyltransferase family 39 protein [Acidobacteriota bacterium]
MSAPHLPLRPRIEQRDLIVLALITALGAGLRLYGLDAQSTWHDETFSVAHSVRDIHTLFAILIDDYVHPPLHYLVLHYWFDIVGYGAWQARLVSAILGTLSVPLLYLLARRFADSATALCAAFLLAVSQMAVYFSQEARPYMQTQFLTLVAALTFISFLNKPNFARAAAFTVSGIALIYTHYYSAGTLLAFGLYWILFRRLYPPQVLPRLAAIVLIMAAAFAPWVIAVGSKVKIGPKQPVYHGFRINPLPGPSAFPNAVNRFNNGKFRSIEAPTSPIQGLLCAALFTLPAIAAFWPGRRRLIQPAVLGALMAALPVAMAIGAGMFDMVFNFRHYSFAVPGYYLLVALGWRRLFTNNGFAAGWLAAATLVCAVALHANYTAPTKPDYRAGFAPMAHGYQPGDCVANRPKRFRLRTHLAWEVYYRDYPLRVVPLDQLSTMPPECGRLWVTWDKTWWMNVRPDIESEDENLQQQLRQRFKTVARFQHPAVDLELYVRRPD